MVWAKDFSVVFIIETWTNEARLVLVHDRLNFKKKIVAPKRNKVWGLVIFWKEDFDLQLRLFLRIT